MSYEFYSEQIDRNKTNKNLQLEYAAIAIYDGLASIHDIKDDFKLFKTDINVALIQHFGAKHCTKCNTVHDINAFRRCPTYRCKSGYYSRCYSEEHEYEKTESCKLSRKKSYNKYSVLPDRTIRRSMSSSIARALKNTAHGKNGGSIMDVLKYTPKQLLEHLESTLPNNMTLKTAMNLDDPFNREHSICALSFTPVSLYSQQIQDMEHFDNLTMMRRSENSRKSDKLPNGVRVRTIKKTHHRGCKRLEKNIYNFYAKPKQNYKKTHSDIDWIFEKVNGVYTKTK